MKNLIITNEAGTTFEYSIEDKFLIIKVTKNGKANTYKTYKTNSIKEGKLNVCREDGSWVDMPVFEAEKVAQFKDGRIKHTFSDRMEYQDFKASNNCGESWVESGNICVYQYI